MNIGHLDSLDESGILSGWFVTDSDSGSDPAIDAFAVLQGDAVLAVGRRTIARPDVQSRYGLSVAGFNVRIVPTRVVTAGVPLMLTLVGSREPVRTNQFVPSEEFLQAQPNSLTSVLQNSSLVESTASCWPFSESYLAEFRLDGFSREFAALYYFCMKDCWPIAPNEWIDLQYMMGASEGKDIASTSPLEILFRKDQPSTSPNCVFDASYVASQLPEQTEDRILSSGEILWYWLRSAEQGNLIRPSPIVRGNFDATGKFKGGKKASLEFLGRLRMLVSGNADFTALASLVPLFDAEWLLTRPFKASENGSTFIRKMMRGVTNTAPNPFFRTDALGLENYRSYCERKDSGEAIALTAVNAALSREVTLVAAHGDLLDVDALARQLRKRVKWKKNFPNIQFVEQLFPGVFDFLDKKTSTKDRSLAFKLYLEQLGIPPSSSAIDLSKVPPGFGPEKLTRLGAIKAGETAKASVIIPTFGRIDLLFNLLVSLANSSITSPVEIIVRDDGSNLDVSVLKFFFPNVNFLAGSENVGFLRNVNAAAKVALGQYLVLVNNDLIVHRRALDELLDALDEYPEAGVVGGLVLSGDGAVQECGGAIWADGTAWNLFRGQSDGSGMPKNVREVDYTSGCWLATRKSTWVAVDGLSDELAPAYCEDMDYCLKVRQLGQRVLVNPHSRVTHLEGQSMGTDTSSKTDGKRFQEINQRKILRKWRAILPSMYSPNGSLSSQFRGYKYLKPLALIYDHYCPEPDRDAGSKTVFEFIAAISKSQSYYPIFVPMNNRYSKYAMQLERMGVEVIHGAGWERLERLISEQSDQISLTLCSRLSVAKHFQWHIGKSGGRKLVYIQDVEEIRHATALGLANEDDAPSVYRRHVKTWEPIYNQFDHVLTCSSAETENLGSQLSIPVTTISPCRASPAALLSRPTGRCEMLFVGSMNHYPNLTGIEWFVTSVLPSIRHKIPDATLHLVGSGFEECTWLQVPGVILHGQVSESTLRFLYSMCNMAVAPLLEGAGTKGKVVEALSHGKPCIGTPIAFQGLDSLLDHVPAQARTVMTGPVASLASRIVKYCGAAPIAGKMLCESVEKSIGKSDPGATLMKIIADQV